MRILFALFVGVALGAGVVWYYGHSHTQIQEAGNQIGDAAKSARDSLEDKLRILDLHTNEIKDELARTGQIVRRKAHEAGQAIADATADARVTAAIKGKLVADRVVTLSGSVPSAEDISKAVLVAMETDGVREVVSTVQIKPSS
jgi:osmotically-inducible protein OsmY